MQGIVPTLPCSDKLGSDFLCKPRVILLLAEACTKLTWNTIWPMKPLDVTSVGRTRSLMARTKGYNNDQRKEFRLPSGEECVQKSKSSSLNVFGVLRVISM